MDWMEKQAKADQPFFKIKRRAVVEFAQAPESGCQRPASSSRELAQELFNQRADGFRQAVVIAREMDGEVPGIAAEDFITSLAAEEHFGVLLARRLADEITGDGGRIGDRIVQVPDDFRQQIHDLRFQDDFLMVRLEGSGQFARVADVVRLSFKTSVFMAETDGKGFERRRTKAAGDGQQTARIHTAAQKQTHRHVADHLAADGLEQQIA